MRALLSASVLVVVSACGFTPLGGETTLLPVVKKAKQPDSVAAVAGITNGLLRDGCSYPITIGANTYAASAATRALVASIAGKRSGETKVNITYRVTGLVGSVECGFGTTQQWPEIEVLALTVIDDVLTDVGSIENGLAYDGCSYPITIGMTTYAPSATSKALVESVGSKKYGETRVSLTFRLSGAMGSVECGWGGSMELPEIEVLTLTPINEVSSGVAAIENGLAYDGCSYPIAIGSMTYAPSAASKALVESVAGKKSGETKARITYRVTGVMGSVTCGWGTTQQLPEIEVLTLVSLANTANVIIHNGLPFDACSYPVELNGVRYAPSVASARLVESFVTQVGANEATIDYEVTGATGSVACGWGGTQSLPEIDVIAIRPRS